MTAVDAIRILQVGIVSAKALLVHQFQVLGGFMECEPCQRACDELDGSLCCDEARELQHDLDRAWRLPILEPHIEITARHEEQA